MDTANVGIQHPSAAARPMVSASPATASPWRPSRSSAGAGRCRRSRGGLGRSLWAAHLEPLTHETVDSRARCREPRAPRPSRAQGLERLAQLPAPRRRAYERAAEAEKRNSIWRLRTSYLAKASRPRAKVREPRWRSRSRTATQCASNEAVVQAPCHSAPLASQLRLAPEQADDRRPRSSCWRRRHPTRPAASLNERKLHEAEPARRPVGRIPACSMQIRRGGVCRRASVRRLRNQPVNERRGVTLDADPRGIRNSAPKRDALGSGR